MISVFSVNKKPLPVAFSTVTITIFVCLDSSTLKLVLNRFFYIVKQIYIISHGVSVQFSLVCSVKEMEVSLVPIKCGVDCKLTVYAYVIYIGL